jgi:hypothetical protein
MFERSEFLTLPIFALHNWAPEGQWQRGRLFWVTFFGEAKKVTGCRATPDLQTAKQQQQKNQKQLPQTIQHQLSTNQITQSRPNRLKQCNLRSITPRSLTTPTQLRQIPLHIAS